jgi:putative NADH-flavin reductase
MKILVVGASGAPRSLVVDQLLKQGNKVTAIARPLDLLPENVNLNKVEAAVDRLTSAEMAVYLKNCDTVVSCLGHKLKGIFGRPRLLVTDTVECIFNAIKYNHVAIVVKVIFMNTTGNSNRDIPELPPLSQRVVNAILRALLPPHLDNERAADY